VFNCSAAVLEDCGEAAESSPPEPATLMPFLVSPRPFDIFFCSFPSSLFPLLTLHRKTVTWTIVILIEEQPEEPVLQGCQITVA
jgi:hypothetical protein